MNLKEINGKDNRKKLGVIAGMGPFAATYFINRLLQLTPAEKEWDYFRIIADYNVFIPSRTRALLFNEKSPAPAMIETFKNLEKAGAEILALPCNSGHGWYDEVEKKINLPWINLIETTSNAVKKRGVDKTLVISAYVPAKKRLYDKYLDNTHYLSEKEQEKVYEIIELLKLGVEKKPIEKKLFDIVKPYQSSIDAIVIACTEPSMLFGMNQKEWGSFQLIDSTNEYAKKCVEVCKGVNL